MKYVIRTLGCKANLFDSQSIEGQLRAAGFKGVSGSDSESPDFCIVNSCSVTDDADRQSRKALKHLKKKYPKAKTILTGCSAEVANRDDPDQFDRLVVNREKSNFVRSLDVSPLSVRGYHDYLSQHPMDRDWPMPDLFWAPAKLPSDAQTYRTRAFLKIQEGCNAFCTYCIIPYGRGPSRSVRPKKILDYTKKLISAGAQEICITGTNIGDYGEEWRPEGEHKSQPLVELLRLLVAETHGVRFRLSSLDPVEVSDSLCELIATNERICPHLHLSVQALTDPILRGMKRRYRMEDVDACFQRIGSLRERLKDFFVGMDLIAGFPGESETLFNKQVEFLKKEISWDRIHAFPYSERAKTPATRLKDTVPLHVRKNRSRKLNELSMSRVRARGEDRVQAGNIGDVLIESEHVRRDGQMFQTGLSRDYFRVEIPAMFKLKPNSRTDLKPIDIIDQKSQWDVRLRAHPHEYRPIRSC